MKSKLYSIILTLVLTIAVVVASVPLVFPQKTNVSVRIQLYPIIGENSPTLITWEPTPNVFRNPPYTVPAWTVTPMWPNATVTFTRPDGSKDIVNGPFNVYWILYGSGSVGFNPRIELVYTPNMQGVWKVNFYWPGDSLYNPINNTDTFTVGPHHDKRTSFAMLSIRPYPAVGLGQEVLINAWVTPPPVVARENFRGFKFTIKRGDGSTYQSFTLDSEAPGVCWFNFWPDKLGNWTITFEWPGNHLYKPCSITRTFTVQTEPIPYPIEDTPLPSTAWKFPINVFNREWRNIAGPWLQSNYNASKGACNPYTVAPKTAHIRWKLPPVSGLGGYIGAYEENTGITTSNIYTSTAADIRCVMAGRGYYAAGGKIYCVDMNTGETLWAVTGSGMSQFGAGTFLIGATRSRAPVLYYFSSRFIVYDALTGAVTLNVTGMPTGMSFLLFDDPYVISYTSTNLIKWTTAGTTNNFAERIIWNVTDPYIQYPWSPPSWPWNYLIHQGLLVYGLQKYGRTTYEDAIMEAIVARNMTTGELVYYKEFIDKTNPDTWVVQQGPVRGAGYGLYFYPITGDPYHINPPETTGGFIAHDVKTGKIAWLSEPFDVYPWGCFFAYSPDACGYGLIYALTYSGVFALNATNGKVVWHYSAGNSGMETPYNTWPFGSVGPVVGGGVVFAPVTEHSPTLYYRGTRLHAIDVKTGKGLWSILGYYTPTAIAYGVLLAYNSPNGYTYAFGKGPTATTVVASPKVVAKCSTILIEGTVTDQSPAQRGTPAIADEYMSQWMEYLHMQQPCPGDAKGVKVKLTAIDSKGKAYDIGTATTDLTGVYAISWTPPEEGAYTIYATFEGSESYYASSATTAIAVGPAPETPEPPEYPQPTDYTPLLTNLTVAVAIATIVIIVIGVANLLMVRKERK